MVVSWERALGSSRTCTPEYCTVRSSTNGRIRRAVGRTGTAAPSYVISYYHRPPKASSYPKVIDYWQGLTRLIEEVKGAFLPSCGVWRLTN
jgi:hypothetical protein